MKKMIRGAFAAAAMVTLAAGLSAADKKAAPAAKIDAAKSNVYAVTFAEIDTNKDGKITLNEYTIYWAKPENAKKAEALQNKDKAAQEATFKKIDKNSDNAIVEEEYTSFFAVPATPATPAVPAVPAVPAAKPAAPAAK